MFPNFIRVTVLLCFTGVTLALQDDENDCYNRCKRISLVKCKEDKSMNIHCKREKKDIIYRYCISVCLKSELNDWNRMLVDYQTTENKVDAENAKRESIIEGLVNSMNLVVNNNPVHISKASFVVDYKTEDSSDDEEETIVIMQGVRKREKREFEAKSFNLGGAIGGSLGGAMSFGPDGVKKEGGASGFAAGYGNKGHTTVKDDGTVYQSNIGAGGGLAGAGKIYGDSYHPNYAVDYAHTGAGALYGQSTAEKDGRQLYGLGGSLGGSYATKGEGVLGTNPNNGLPMLSTISKTVGDGEVIAAGQVGNIAGATVNGTGHTEGISRYNTGLAYGPNGLGIEGVGKDRFVADGQLAAKGGIGQFYPTIPYPYGPYPPGGPYGYMYNTG